MRVADLKKVVRGDEIVKRLASVDKSCLLRVKGGEGCHLKFRVPIRGKMIKAACTGWCVGVLTSA